MNAPARLVRAENALRNHALAYPDTVEEFPWGHRAIKVKGKAFVFMAFEDSEFSLSVKLPESNMAALMFPFAAPTGYGLGKSGWVTARFGAKEQPPIEMLISWIDESFRAIAPKSIVRQLPAAGSARSPATKRAAKPRDSKSGPVRGRKKTHD
jgi:predicted DNA-binding protein (MmcQ/YjbR family)